MNGKMLGCLLLLTLAFVPTTILARDLKFEDRIRAQEAIERVYFSHQAGTARPFEQAVPRVLLEAKVRLYLKQSLALDRIWHTPVTTEMLLAEADRMARETRMPERLAELHRALGDDPFLIQECLVRPVLVDRLVRNLQAFDRSFQAPAATRAEVAFRQPAGAENDGWMLVEVLRAPEGVGAGASPPPSIVEGGRTRLRLFAAPEEFERYRPTGVARAVAAGRILEERERFVVTRPIETSPDRLLLSMRTIDKIGWDDWWAGVAPTLDEHQVVAVAGGTLPPLAPACQDDHWDNQSLGRFPQARQLHTAVWTGSVMLVWGGTMDFGEISAGRRYDPATGTWSDMSTAGEPARRTGHSGVWTGTRLLIWGGRRDGVTYGDGAVYDPVSDSWVPMSMVNAPEARSVHATVWTGSEMLVWGGGDDTPNVPLPLATGGRYDPVADLWQPITTLGAPEARLRHTAVWTGTEMIVWGGVDVNTGNHFGNGGRYDPAADTWSPVATTGAPSARYGHTAVWTDTRMVIWGGENWEGIGTYYNDGAIYDPSGNSWVPTASTGAPTRRAEHVAAWTGSAMIVLGGQDYVSGYNSKLTVAFNPVANQWSQPPGAWTWGFKGHSAVWTGQRLIVWGGYADGISVTNMGFQYDPATDSTTATGLPVGPARRENHTAVWSGNLMLIWGGFAGNVNYMSGGSRYDPATDSWSPFSLGLLARFGHTAVWTGDRMIVYGGRSYNPGTGQFPYENTGATYDPIANTDQPISAAPIPGRTNHSAVWTGDRMLVWGGRYFDGINAVYANSGARYDPAANTWATTNLSGAPVGREKHTAVWSGTRMILWGGNNASSTFASGGQYDPQSNTWSAVSTMSAPSPRGQFTTVWTGSRMIVWGGTFGSRFNTGASYDPDADLWTPLPTDGAPTARFAHRAVWTGSLMIVWGGDDSGGNLPASGGRYDPASSRWDPLSTDRAPSGRVNFSAVWAGDRMIAWGGSQYSAYLGDGGMYCACAGPVSLYYSDADDDGWGDAALPFSGCAAGAGRVATPGDCSDSDPTAWGTPGEVPLLDWIDTETLTWSAPGPAGGTATHFDVLRTAVPSDFDGAATCSATAIPGTFLIDAGEPPLGGMFYYLVRARNACPSGLGALGNDSFGTARIGRVCGP